MKRTTIAALSLLGAFVLGVIVALQAKAQRPVPTKDLVGALRLLNTEEYSYRQQNGRFAARQELLNFIQGKGIPKALPLNLEDPKPYVLAITTSSDGSEYQIELARPIAGNDKSTACNTAAFSDQRGVIFLGVPLDCEAAPR